MSLRRTAIFFSAASLIFFAACSRHFKTRRFLYFGTFIDISLPQGTDEKIFSLLEDEMKRCHNLLSVKEGSTAELNRKGLLRSAELAGLLRRVRAAHDDTGGLFDPTVEPLLKSAGFSPAGATPGEAPAYEPEKVLGDVGFDKITIDGDLIRLGGALLNFGGCGKGYLLERLSGILEEQGVVNALINAGGDILAMGKNNGKLWRLGVRRPGEQGFNFVLGLSGKSVATSGDYENFAVVNGERRNHILDPSTGRSSDKRQVTVIGDEPLEADIYATAFMLMDTDSALRLADERGMGIMIYESDGAVVSNGIFDRFQLR